MDIFTLFFDKLQLSFHALALIWTTFRLSSKNELRNAMTSSEKENASAFELKGEPFFFCEYGKIRTLLEKGEKVIRKELPLTVENLKRVRLACICKGEHGVISYLKCFEKEKVRSLFLTQLKENMFLFVPACLEAYMTREEMRGILFDAFKRGVYPSPLDRSCNRLLHLLSKEEILEAFPVNDRSFSWWEWDSNAVQTFFNMIPRDQLDEAYPMSKENLKKMMRFHCLSLYAPDKEKVLEVLPPTWDTLHALNESRKVNSYMDYIGWHHHLDTLFPRNQEDVNLLTRCNIRIESCLENEASRHIVISHMNKARERLRLSPDANEETVKAHWDLLEKTYALTED